MSAHENAQEDKRRIEQADGKFEKGSQAAGPAGPLGEDEWPKLCISFGCKMHVMHLVHDPVEAEREETEHTDDDAIEFIQAATLAEETVGGLVKSDQHSVHQMRRDQDKWYGKPDPPHPDRGPERSFGQAERDHERLKGDATHIVLLVQIGNAFGSGRDVYHFSLLARQFAFPASGKCFSTLS